MYFSSLFAAASLAATAAFAVPHKPASGATSLRHNNIFNAQLQKRAGSVITSGAAGLGDGEVHSRLEISDLAANRPYQWALYIRTMAQWQAVAQDDNTGYYGISSIHGVPRETWDDVAPCDSCDGADGYATHDTFLFPSWHRAYVALFEQEFLKLAATVADSFEGDFKTHMVAAAQKLRVPYLDWAAAPDAGSDTLPSVLTSEQLTVAGPNGQETLTNPLYSFHFTDSSGMYYTPFTTWQDTFRYPTSNEASATSQDSKAVTAFNNARENVQDQIYSLLANCGDFLHFATDNSGTSDASCANSIEGIHNTIHTLGGGSASSDVSGGHLTYLPLSSYDPLFWIHHTNVDRLFALWQTVHPDSYGAAQDSPHATWTIATGTALNADSPLEPFRKTADTFWTTNDVKDWTAFKYTYPEFENSDGSQTAIINYINNLYGTNANLTASSISKQVEKNNAASSVTTSSTSANAVRDRTTLASSATLAATSTSSASETGGWGIGIGIGPISISLGLPFGGSHSYPTNTASASAGWGHNGWGPSAWNGTATAAWPAPTGTGVSSSNGSTAVDPSFIAPNGSYYHYQCNVDTPRYAFNGSYSIYVFDGEPTSDDASEWLGDDNCIGTIGVLAGSAHHSSDLIISGSVPVTRHLQKQCKAGKLEGMAEEYVTPYMTKNLNWKIVYNGEEVHPTALSGFKSSFFSSTSTPAGYGELPVLSELIPKIEVTKDKAGGVQNIAEALGDAVGSLTSAIGSLLPTPTAYATSTSPAETYPAITAAPSTPTSPEEAEETVTVWVTEYETVCPCSEAAPTASAY